MKKRWLRYDGVIQDVLLKSGADSWKDAEIHAVLKDGTDFVCHHRPVTKKDLALLRNSIGQQFHCEVEVSAEAKA
jgi:hypothetical protein